MNDNQVRGLIEALRPAGCDAKLYPLIQPHDKTLANPQLASVQQLADLESAVRLIADRLPVQQAVRLLEAAHPLTTLRQVGVRQMVERMASMLSTLAELDAVDVSTRREILQLLADSRRCV